MVAEHDLLKKFLAIQERIHTVFEDSLASLQGDFRRSRVDLVSSGRHL